MQVIVKRNGKSEMFYELVSGKTLFVGVDASILPQSIPTLPDVSFIYNTDWMHITSDEFLSDIGKYSFETVVFYTYDSYKIRKKDVEYLDSKLSSFGAKCIFMFSRD